MMAVVGNKIKELRQSYGWTQAVMAKQLQISTPALSKIEAGITDTTLSRLDQIAACLRVSTAELFSVEKIPNQTEIDEVNIKLEERESELRELQAKTILLLEELRKKEQTEHQILKR